MGILDSSSYLNEDTAEGFVLQVVMPGAKPEDAVELNYYQKGVTILNSNVLGLTNVDNEKHFTNLPDGLWAAKISICPYNQFWYEKKWFRTCELECKFNKAFLSTKINECTACFAEEKLEKLALINRYMVGIKANVSDCNYKAASNLYTTANSLLDQIVDCDCK